MIFGGKRRVTLVLLGDIERPAYCSALGVQGRKIEKKKEALPFDWKLEMIDCSEFDTKVKSF